MRLLHDTGEENLFKILQDGYLKSTKNEWIRKIKIYFFKTG